MIDLANRREFAPVLGGFNVHEDRRPGTPPVRFFALTFPEPDLFDGRQWATLPRLVYDAVSVNEVDPGWWVCDYIPEHNPVVLLASDEFE